MNPVGFGVRTEHRKSNDSRGWVVSPTKARFFCMWCQKPHKRNVFSILSFFYCVVSFCSFKPNDHDIFTWWVSHTPFKKKINALEGFRKSLGQLETCRNCQIILTLKCRKQTLKIVWIFFILTWGVRIKLWQISHVVTDIRRT